MQSKIASLVLFGGIAASSAAQTAGVRCAERDFQGAVQTGLGTIHVELDGAYAFASSPTFLNQILVFEVTDFQSPTLASEFDVAGEPQRFQIRGDKLFVASGDWVLRVFDIESPTDAIALGGIRGSGFGYAVDLVGDVAVVAAGEAGILVLDVATPSLPTLLGSADTTGEARDVLVRDGIAYVADGFEGLQLIDVSDPANPMTIGYVDTPNFARRIALRGDHAYIADGLDVFDLGGGIEIIDVSDSEFPTLVASHATIDNAIDLRIEGDRLYAATRSGGIEILDIGEPAMPVLIGRYGSAEGIRSIDVRDEIVAMTREDNGLRLLDATDPKPTPIIGSTTVDGRFSSMVLDDNIVIGSTFVGVGDARLHTFDLSDPSSPERLATVPIDGIFHNLARDGDALFLSANGDPRTISVFDISDSRDPRSIATVPVPGSIGGMVANDGVLFVANVREGLVVYDISDPATPTVISTLDLGSAGRLRLDGDRMYVKVGSVPDDATMVIVDVTDPFRPVILSEILLNGFVNDIEVLGPSAVLAAGRYFTVIDVEDPTHPVIASQGDGPASTIQRLSRRGHVLLADNGGPILYDVRNQFAPVYVGRVPLDGNSAGFGFLNGAVVCASSSGRLTTIDISDCCPADLDGDGTTTIFDFLTFQNLFQDQDPRADFDGDGDFTLFDFLAFQDAFAAGCP